MLSDKVPYIFNPDIRSPVYLIRKGLYNAVKQYAPQLKGVLLDFGCGAKPYESLFNVDKYIGIDLHNPAHPHENESVDVFYDGKIIPFPDNHFDALFSTEVIEHVFNLDEILTEINRVMKSKGKMLITCPFVYPEHEVPYDYARYTTFALHDLLKKNGFKVLSIEKTGNSIQCIMQLRILNLISYNLKMRVLNAILWKTVSVAFNTYALLLSRIFPERKDLYLNNVVLCEKN